MSLQLSQVVPSNTRGREGDFSVKAIDIKELGEWASPVVVLDDFRVSSRPFPPHPHAGFSAVTYVFEDSSGGLHSRDSLGNDVVVGPGGIVWTQAGSGLIHHEVPAEVGRELHGLQLFVNLSKRNKLVVPQMFHLAAGDVPEWRSAAGDRVRVVVGSYEGVASPLVPAEPFNLLDVELHGEISAQLEAGHNMLIYVVSGDVRVRADGRQQEVPGGNAMAIHGSGRATFEAVYPSNMVVLSGAEIREPVLIDGPFIMNERTQVEAAYARFQSGQMGRLEPLARR